MKFKQIAVAVDPEYGEALYALGTDGIIYEKTSKLYSPGGQYDGRRITKGSTRTGDYWKPVDLPFKEPPLTERQLRILDFQIEDGGND